MNEDKKNLRIEASPALYQYLMVIISIVLTTALLESAEEGEISPKRNVTEDAGVLSKHIGTQG